MDGWEQRLRPRIWSEAILQRYKELGVNADQLWEDNYGSETRTLIRVTIDDLARAERRVSSSYGMSTLEESWRILSLQARGNVIR